jgi:hypothetical protein
VHRSEKLKSFGCDDVVTSIGRTGVIGVNPRPQARSQGDRLF